ncbi:ABC transporter permease subunit [Streptomyces alkaliphilus]|uniref:ABC transporter permease subunit n=1 Tax=Streptomyces alkaliphilus TaxID=1472722 RepID=A0A7W3TGR4_9ACTN|nr:ABC transporter permease subunit [Streptomyces alkaliphilus]
MGTAPAPAASAGSTEPTRTDGSGGPGASSGGAPAPAHRPPPAPVAWLRRNAVVIVGLMALGYLLLPNLVVLAYSFNDPAGRFNHQWQSFSTEAWTNPCAVPEMCSALGLSLRIALLATLVATAFGTLAAFALVRYRFKGRNLAQSLIFLPMAMPEVVMAASVGTLFLNMRVEFGFTTILIAHIMFCLSFVIVAVKARVASMDPRLEEAARDLYAGPVQAFVRVTLPIAAPGIAAGAMLSFALSFDDFIITQFNAGPSTVTFPMFVWGAAQRGVPVQVNVIGSAMFILAVVIVLAGQILGRRRAARV